jgi:hypothetical protein
MLSSRSISSERSTVTRLMRAVPVVLACLVVGVTASPRRGDVRRALRPLRSRAGRDPAQVGVDTDGDAAVTWRQRYDRTTWQVEGAIGP